MLFMKRIVSFTALAVFLCALLPVTVCAQQLIYNLDYVYSGDEKDSPDGVTAVFTDLGSTVQLDMSLTTTGAVGTIGQWYFNYNDNNGVGIDGLTAELVLPNPGFWNQKGSNGLTIDADGAGKIPGTNQAGGSPQYDILFDFAPPPGTDKFDVGESISFIFSNSNGELDVSNFLALSGVSPATDVKSQFYSAAKINLRGDAQAWIAAGEATVVPETSTYLLLGSMLGMTGVVIRRRKKAIL